MIVMFSDEGQSFDFITLTSLKFAMDRISGPIVPWSLNIDFTDAKQLALIGHGSCGSISGVCAKTIADRIAQDKYGVPKDINRIVITSCNAGVRYKQRMGTSVVEVIADALCKRKVEQVEISGALGPSVKANVLGEEFTVIDPAKKTGTVQRQLEAKHQLVKPSDLEPTLNPLKPFLQSGPKGSTIIKGKFYEAKASAHNDSLFQSRMEIAAAAAEMGTRRFYKEFDDDLKRGRLNLSGSGMRTIKIAKGKMTCV